MFAICSLHQITSVRGFLRPLFGSNMFLSKLLYLRGAFFATVFQQRIALSCGASFQKKQPFVLAVVGFRSQRIIFYHLQSFQSAFDANSMLAWPLFGKYLLCSGSFLSVCLLMRVSLKNSPISETYLALLWLDNLKRKKQSNFQQQNLIFISVARSS